MLGASVLKDKNLWGLVAGLTASSIWGGMYVVSKWVLEVIPPFALLNMRLFLGTLVLGLILWWKGWRGFSRKDIGRVLGIGAVGYGVSLGMQFVGTRMSTASNGAVITSAVPAFVFLFAVWMLNERISARRGWALVLSTLGVLIVIDPRAAELAPELFWGNVILAGAGISWAYYSVLVRKMTRELDTLSMSFVAFCGGILVAVPLGVWEGEKIDIELISFGILAGILYLGVVSTALAAYLWNKAFEMLEAGLASLTFFAQPIVGIIFGIVFLDETVTTIFFVGGILVSGGIWLAASESLDNRGE